MIRRPTLNSLILLSGLATAAAAGALVSPAQAEGDGDGAKGPCTATKFNFPAVEQACKQGGRDKVVQDIMRPAKNKANATGMKIKDERVGCKSCHIDQKKDFKLTDNAIEDLKKLLPPPPAKK
jgi:hypothetical protein